MSNKLIPKDKPGNSIKEIAARLGRNTLSESISESQSEKENKDDKEENIEDIKGTEISEKEDENLNIYPDKDQPDWLQRMNNKNYDCKEVLYVDKDIKEVFSLLKRKKIQISSLVSLILEDWLNDHMDEIKPIIKSKNRFL